MSLCECGCGKEANPGRRFINHHNLKVKTQEIIDKQSKSLRQHYIDNPETKDKIRLTLLQFNKEHPEAGKAHSEWMIEHHKDPEVLKAMSERAIEYWSNQDAHNEMSEIKKQWYIDNPEALTERTKMWQEYWADQANCDDQSKRLKLHYSDIINRERHSAAIQGQDYDAGEWTGFVADEDWREWDKAIFINKPFPGCARHHITKTIVACIPKELHEHLYHRLKDGYNMGEMNMLALQFIHGCYDN